MNDTAAHPPTDAVDAANVETDAAPTDRKKRRRRGWLIVLLAVACYAAWAYWPADNRIVVSRETTYLTEPLKADGTVDYVAAVRQRLSEGVTPENNAAPLLLRALGPGLLAYFDLPAILAELHMADLPEDGDYFITLRDYARTLPPEQAEALLAADDYQHSPLNAATPWTPEEHPQLADWVAHNDGPLDAIVAATEQPRLYFPLVSDEDDLLCLLPSPDFSLYRNVAAALRCRAMLALSQGDAAGAWQDILACYRLAGLVGQGPSLIDDLVSRGIEERVACESAMDLLASGDLAPEQLRSILTDMEALPPSRHPAETFSEFERLVLLDIIVGMANEPDNPGLDWDLILRMCNASCDEIVATLRLDSYDDVRAFFACIEEPDYIEEIMLTLIWASRKARFGGRPFRGAASRRVAKVMLQFYLPSTGRMRLGHDETVMRREMVKLAMGLELYERDHGEYPATLEDLVPDYAQQVPGDCFSGGPVRYIRTADTCRMYSLGQNETDDGGFNYDDFRAAHHNAEGDVGPDAVMPEGMTEDADDIVIELGRGEE